MLSSSNLGSAALGRALALLAGFLTTSIVAGFIAAGLFMPAADAAGSFARGSVSFFDSLPAEFEQRPLSEATIVYAKDGKTQIARFFHENRVLVPLNAVALVMRQAIVAIEDERFYDHGGFDVKGVSRAALKNMVSGRTEQGASTITQQYVKNVLLEQAYAEGNDAAMKAAVEQTMSRKVREMKYAISLENTRSKDEILEGYLNVALFGDNVYGVEAASRYFFGTHASKLTLTQAATLAGLVQLPSFHNPRTHPDRALSRRNVVLSRMRVLGAIDEATYQEAVKAKLGLKLTPSRNGCANAVPGYNAYFCEYVRRALLLDPEYAALGPSAKERERKLNRGGLRITTTLDPKIQKYASQAVNRAVPPKDKSKLAAAAVTVQPNTGHVIAMAQNRSYNPAGKRGQTTINYTVDMAHGGAVNGWQPGSTFKPFTLATWLSDGKSLKARVPAPRSLSTTPGDWSRSCQRQVFDNGVWNAGNAGDTVGGGSVSVLDASAGSINTAYISMARQLDLCDIMDTADKFGLKTLKNGKFSKLQPFAAAVLGSQTVTPLGMAAAYAGFANRGKYCTPVTITKIMDHGTEIPVPKTKCNQAVSKEVAAGLSYALSQVLIRGTAAGKGIGRPAAGKTGTTNSSVDTWFVGYTPQLSTAVWVANPDTYTNKQGQAERYQLTRVSVKGAYPRTIYGGTIAAPIWQDMMSKAHKGLPVVGFSDPPGDMLKVEEVDLPDFTGQQVDQVVKALQDLGFESRVERRPVPSDAPPGTVAYTNPPGGSKVEPGTQVVIHISNGVPPGDDQQPDRPGDQQPQPPGRDDD